MDVLAATPYSKYLFGEAVSVGKRVAMEIQAAIDADALEKITT
jgi:5-formaminoimidazole-4-carboxamide-1-beta-D-ribofuranosyl 5'-monophosphate synthetase